MEAFLNPTTALIGAALVSLPIIIHLINRIRFRRVRWAAMEFLLKAQKKMRRKKILEQLILLLLRMLLVALAGVLFARFIGCGDGSGKETRPTTHIVILDDTPSMADVGKRDDGAPTTAFAEAKRIIYEKLAPAIGEATTPQALLIVRQSDPDQQFPARTKTADGKETPRSAEEVRDEARVVGRSVANVEDYLKPLQLSPARKPLTNALLRAKALLEAAPATDARVVHVVSDTRAADWALEGPAIQNLLADLKENNVTVHFIDVCTPARKPDRKSPQFNDNVGIVEVRPRNRVVTVNQKTELDVRVKNFGSTSVRDLGISFYLNGQGNVITSANVPDLPANQERTITVEVRFPEITNPDERQKLGPLSRFRLVTVALSNPEPGGLQVDNARHVAIEVRDAVKVLIVDGRTVEGGVDLRTTARGDSGFVRSLLNTPKGIDELGKIQIVNGEAAQLATTDLRPFSVVYLMNVPALSEAAVKNLEAFASAGGGVAVFLGPNVKSADYNTQMHRGGTGFFPVPLANEFSKELTVEQKLTRTLAFNPRLMLRDPSNRSHPALSGIYTDARGREAKDVERFFLIPNIDHYWPVPRLGPWREDRSVQELYCLQNDAPIGAFEGRATDLIGEIKKRYIEAKFEKARKYLDPMLENIRRTPAETKPLSELARLMDDLLCDQVSLGDEREPVLRDFWQQPELADLRVKAAALRDATKYGDPLYVVKQFGRGRVAVMTTDAGGQHGDKIWTDWPSLGGAGWSVVVAEMHKYLAGGGDEANRSVGDKYTAEFDFAKYTPEVALTLLTADASKPSADRRLTWEAKPLGKLVMDKATKPADAKPDDPEPPYKLAFDKASVPGAYVFALTRRKAAGPAAGAPDALGDTDFISVPFNTDALIEGDLRRANTDDVAALTNKAPLHNTEDLKWIDDLKQKPTDLSSRRWLYLLLLLVLIAEQAWAVRISYHTKPEDLEALAPSAAAVFAHGTAPRATEVEEVAPANAG
jgi:Aerotolerance regulator N-terminal